MYCDYKLGTRSSPLRRTARSSNVKSTLRSHPRSTGAKRILPTCSLQHDSSTPRTSTRSSCGFRSQLSYSRLAQRMRARAGNFADDHLSSPDAENKPEGSRALPWWVYFLNQALDLSPVMCIIAFVIIDISSCLLILALVLALKIQVDADFALAYAIAKAVRVPRLALDGAAAALLMRLYPPLAAVRVDLMVDAAARLSADAWRFFWKLRGTVAGQGSAEEPPAPKSADSDSAAEQVKRALSSYGLAYMAAKNFIGMVSILGMYLAMRLGGLDLNRWLQALGGSAGASAGHMAGTMCLASWASTVIFPFVVLGCAILGPWMHYGMEAIKRMIGDWVRGKSETSTLGEGGHGGDMRGDM
ncbi:hypothetical protein CYMTET_49657 [Cymbomonas tetramitiformis]|uniref:Uncharacterized protein n=1 Tax=Cymbomonas tetramitiformis TaxID=36881 RepID=A0AAE0BRE2_9CHLO|nr:hypothetical protein CYMTET_49657 [Cymbomonas tetramitiformis]